MHPYITGMLVEDRIATLRAEAAAQRPAALLRRALRERRRGTQQVPTLPVRLPEQRRSRQATLPARERVDA